VLAVATALGGESLATVALERTGGALSPVGQGLVRDTLLGASGRAPATIISLPLLVWSTLKVFRGLDVAFSRIYGTAVAPGFLGQVRDAAVALAGVATGLAAVAAVGLLVGVSSAALAGLLGSVGLVIVLTVAFFPLYYLFPDRRGTVRDALPGAVFAAVGWTVLGTAFRIYAANAGQFALYGVLGVVLLLVTWYYVGSIVILVGASLNAVLSGRTDETGNYNTDPADASDTERA
jgi:uncharacterized BrkB/YihY/UPF0761 family membrane protein